MTNSTCVGIDCERPVDRIAAQLCFMHYQRLRKHGDANWQPPVPPAHCSVDGCALPHTARGWCNMHYARWLRTGSVADRPEFIPDPCSIDGCDGVVAALGWCVKHYTRNRMNGSPHITQRERNNNPPETCTIGACELPHHAHGMCHPHYSRSNHAANAPARNALAALNYAADPDAYALRSSRRRRNLTEGMTAADIDISNAYRKAIKADPCTYCGAPSDCTDHIFPVAKGGRDFWFNLTRSCTPCNLEKAAHCGTWFTLRAGGRIVQRLPDVGPAGSVDPGLAA